MGVTSSGLRWPEPATDTVTQGAVNIRNLAEDVTTKYGRGILGRTLAAQIDINNTGGTLMSTVVTLSAQRWIRVYVNLTGIQITAATTGFNASVYCNNTAQTRIAGGPIALNDGPIFNGDAYFLAPAGSLTVDLRIVGISAGAFRVSGGGATFLTVVDVGGPTSF